MFTIWNILNRSSCLLCVFIALFELTSLIYYIATYVDSRMLYVKPPEECKDLYSAYSMHGQVM